MIRDPFFNRPKSGLCPFLCPARALGFLPFFPLWGRHEETPLASIYKRGRFWWAKFPHQGRVFRRSLHTPNRQLARERARHFERTVRDGAPLNREGCIHSPMDAANEEFGEHQRVIKAQSSAQTDEEQGQRRNRVLLAEMRAGRYPAFSAKTIR